MSKQDDDKVQDLSEKLENLAKNVSEMALKFVKVESSVERTLNHTIETKSMLKSLENSINSTTLSFNNSLSSQKEHLLNLVHDVDKRVSSHRTAIAVVVLIVPLIGWIISFIKSS